MTPLRVAATALLACLLLAGCTEDEPDVKVAPPPSASTAPDPEIEPWQLQTHAGAKAFISHWMDLFSEAQRSGDVGGMKAASAADCENCNTYIRNVNAFHRKGGVVHEGGWSVVGARQAIRNGHERQFAVKVLIRDERLQRHPEGRMVRNKASRFTMFAKLQWQESTWQMEQLWLVP